MNKNSKVLALKYRPQTFDDLIGQDVVSETILNSIKANKIPNAFLFTGIRGIGKTTTARIVAKSLNCLNGIDNLCKENYCDNCDSITNSSHIDVLEMDAASKTGVDDVRDLIEFSRYGPTSSKYKIFIIDEVHMLSKQAFNALLKTLEEPPEYLKFIFATTEIKKIPITVVSRCQRFDLSRIKSSELFKFIKQIKDKEKGNVSDDALKLIVKISEGSVRDALSLLDRGLLALKNNELDLKLAQKIFGYFDKSQLIELFTLVLDGNNQEVLDVYKKIYDQGVEPKVFINDFLELIYYFKNINSLTLEGTNFSLNDSEFLKIKELSNSLDDRVLILFWQFSIKTLEELDIVSNQNLSIEMFLMRLMHLSAYKSRNDKLESKKLNKIDEIKHKTSETNTEIISQIRNVTQEKKTKPLTKEDVKVEKNISIDSFDQLLKVCTETKEIKLKYELEKNVNLVSFEKNRIEISFNDNLDKDFVKDLSTKLFELTGDRWIITFSKTKGEMSIKDQEKNKKINLIQEMKKTTLYKSVLEKFPDANLLNVKLNKKDEN
jgi:DNA polymerase III subunit gamma/tau